MAQDFILGNQRGCRILGHHETRIDSGLPHEQRRQTVLSLQEKVRPPFGNAGKFSQGECCVIQDESQRLAVKVSSADNVPIGEHQRIIGHRIDFRFHHIDRVLQGIATGSVDLGNAPKTVGILYLPAIPVRFEDLAVAEKTADVVGYLSGTRVGSYFAQTAIKRLDAPLDRLLLG